MKLKWCQRRDLNPRPKAYESSALPLSYSGEPGKGIMRTIVRVSNRMIEPIPVREAAAQVASKVLVLPYPTWAGWRRWLINRSRAARI